MNNKLLSLRLVIFLGLAFTAIAGLYLHNVKNTLTQSSQCQMVDDGCVFQTPSVDLQFYFLQPPIIEEELAIYFKISPGSKIKRAWIEGVNMYMGKTPVVFESLNGGREFTGLTFLGGCSEPTMQWQLFIEVNNAEKTEVYSALFKTTDT